MVLAAGSRRLLTVLPLLCLLATGGCASDKQQKRPSEPEFHSRHKAVNPLSRSDEPDDGMVVEGLAGTLDPQQVRAGLDPLLPKAARCFQRTSRSKPYVGGTISLKFRVSRGGLVKRIQITASSVGSWPVERCVLQALRAARFDKPSGGGDAEFSFPITFQARAGVQDWESSHVTGEMEKIKAAARKEGKSTPKGLVLTFYVDAKGKVSSVGFAADAPVSDELATWLEQQLQAATFELARASHAKVSYRW